MEGFLITISFAGTLLYPFFKRFKRNIKCWYSHNWVKTNRPNVEECTKCGDKVIVINAIYEDE